MPAVIKYILDTRSPDYAGIEEVFEKEMDARTEKLTRNWAYYRGDMEKPLKLQKDRVDDNVLLPKVDQVADKLVSFLLGDGVRFDVGGDNQQGTADDALEALWQANSGSLLLHNIALSGIMSGHCWTRIEPRADDLPRIVGLNPAHCSAFWNAEDIADVLWYRLQFRLNDGDGAGKRVDYVQGHYANGEFDHSVKDEWWEVVYKVPNRGSRWIIQGDPVLFPHEWPPVVDWQNSPSPFEYYGADDIHAAVRLNDMLNFVASNYARILKHHAHPKTVGIGFDASAVIESEIGGFYTVNKPKQEADLFNLEMQSDLASSREFMSTINAEIWQASRLVDPQTLRDRVGQLTNFGIRVLYTDAIRKVETKRLLYAEGLERINQRCLELMGNAVDADVVTIWDDVLPMDDEAIAAVLLQEVAGGLIDRTTYQEMRDYDPEQIAERLAAQGEAEGDIGTRLLQAFERGA